MTIASPPCLNLVVLLLRLETSLVFSTVALMSFTESAGQHRPIFYHPTGESPRQITLEAREKLDYFTRLPIFSDLLDEIFEKMRPVVMPDGTKQRRDIY